MILPDINILIYAHNEGDERFLAANKWFVNLLAVENAACFCWETINGFIRISTNPRAMAIPLSLKDAFSAVRHWLDSPNAIVLKQTSRHLEILERVSIYADSYGSRFSDAVLAALAIEHNVTIATTDVDFPRFDGLNLLNLLDQN